MPSVRRAYCWREKHGVVAVLTKWVTASFVWMKSPSWNLRQLFRQWHPRRKCFGCCFGLRVHQQCFWLDCENYSPFADDLKNSFSVARLSLRFVDRLWCICQSIEIMTVKFLSRKFFFVDEITIFSSSRNVAPKIVFCAAHISVCASVASHKCARFFTFPKATAASFQSSSFCCVFTEPMFVRLFPSVIFFASSS